jgi:hypothetical protein
MNFDVICLIAGCSENSFQDVLSFLSTSKYYRELLTSSACRQLSLVYRPFPANNIKDLVRFTKFTDDQLLYYACINDNVEIFQGIAVLTQVAMVELPFKYHAHNICKFVLNNISKQKYLGHLQLFSLVKSILKKNDCFMLETIFDQIKDHIVSTLKRKFLYKKCRSVQAFKVINKYVEINNTSFYIALDKAIKRKNFDCYIYLIQTWTKKSNGPFVISEYFKSNVIKKIFVTKKLDTNRIHEYNYYLKQLEGRDILVTKKQISSLYKRKLYSLADMLVFGNFVCQVDSLYYYLPRLPNLIGLIKEEMAPSVIKVCLRTAKHTNTIGDLLVKFPSVITKKLYTYVREDDKELETFKLLIKHGAQYSTLVVNKYPELMNYYKFTMDMFDEEMLPSIKNIETLLLNNYHKCILYICAVFEDRFDVINLLSKVYTVPNVILQFLYAMYLFHDQQSNATYTNKYLCNIDWSQWEAPVQKYILYRSTQLPNPSKHILKHLTDIGAVKLD